METTKNAGVVAAIMRDHEYDSVAMVERRRWRVQFNLAPERRMFTDSRRAAVERCEELGIPYVLAAEPRA